MNNNLSPEERQELLDKAQLERKRKRLEGIDFAEKYLKLDYDEEGYWKELASKLGIRRFQWYVKADPKHMRKALKKVGRDAEWFKDITGFSTFREHEKANPSMTANSFLGFMCEQVNEEISQ